MVIGCWNATPEGSARLRLEAMLGHAHRRRHLLLEVARVATVVEGADRGRVVEPAARGVAEVVADEAGGRVAHAEPVWRVQLRIPRVLTQPDVVPARAERRSVELDACVDAIVGSAVGRGAREVGVHRVQGQSGLCGLRRSEARAGKTPVIEVDADRSARGYSEVGLEVVDPTRIVFYPDGMWLCHAAL